MSRIGFDLHAAAASIALLAAPEFTVNEGLVHFETSRNPGQECNQSLSMGFSGREVAQHKFLIVPDRGRKTLQLRAAILMGQFLEWSRQKNTLPPRKIAADAEETKLASLNFNPSRNLSATEWRVRDTIQQLFFAV